MPHQPPSRKGWLAHYSEFMQACARRFGNQADAEDAAHDAVEALLQKGDGAVSAVHARNFLYRAAHHRAIDTWRRESRYQHIAWDDVPEDAHPTVAGADAQATTEQLIQALVATLEELPLNCRRAFVLNRIEGWTQTEIARHLKLSLGSVERYIARATQHVREHMRDDD